MKNILILLAALSLVACKEGNIESTIPTDKEATAEISKEEFAKNEKASFAHDVKIIDSLKSKFHIKKDEFDKSVWINHKAFGTKYWPNRCTLAVYIREDGSYYTQSNYYGEDWVFHTNVQVKLGDEVFTSETIPTYSKNNIKDNDGGQVWEVVQYTENTPDIAQAISYYDGKGPVKIRFNGRQSSHDVVLSKSDRKAITESIMFAEALKGTFGKIGAPKI
ncbi:hypothetical protein Q765_00315 [Flavobacterium rivuli WB 3.3-2 = DSM 21788]|uniref:Lipoprotein n=1 Tax=Flavobacterium rivuli WB 3.3-2 = DSM 21788 TaxID=1121895 RepID=A0A0A2MJ83_9FLAO|nr:hypothetical protein [Flavobacterium rivuli]KGO88395.1 hypothetical protein Q765_00315 [Flavobacterium rivuli WB 3.3-2 = DSM 21788]